MKKKLKRILSLLLILVMLLSLAACGKDKEEGSTAEGGENNVTLLADELGYGYLSSYQELEMPIDYVSSVSSVGGKLYLAGDRYNEETYMSETLMTVIDPATGEVTSNPIGQMEENQYFQNISIAGDGSGYWMIVVTWNDQGFEEIDPGFGVDMEEPAEGEEVLPEEAPADSDDLAAEGAVEMMPALGARTEEAEVTLLSATAVAVPAVEVPAIDDGEYIAPTEIYELIKYDMEGNKIHEIDLTVLMEEMEYFYAQNVVELTGGDVILFCDEKIVTFGADGKAVQ